MPDAPFKKCGSCRAEWKDPQSFVVDPSLRLLGLQVVPNLPDANVLVFEHRCGSSISTLTSKLRHLVDRGDEGGDLPRLFGTDACSGHCRLLADLASCDRPCGNARDRRLAILVSAIKNGLADLGVRTP